MNLAGNSDNSCFFSSWSCCICVTAVTLLFSCALSSCTPRIEVAAPEKPITINLNVKIDHEVRVKVEKDLDKVLSENSELF